MKKHDVLLLLFVGLVGQRPPGEPDPFMMLLIALAAVADLQRMLSK
jgi:hypothetical protein